MRLSFSEDIQASLFKVLTVLRYLIPLSFYILSIPFILFNIDRASIQNPFLLEFPLSAIAILSSWKTLSKELRREPKTQRGFDIAEPEVDVVKKRERLGLSGCALGSRVTTYQREGIERASC